METIEGTIPDVSGAESGAMAKQNATPKAAGKHEAKRRQGGRSVQPSTVGMEPKEPRLQERRHGETPSDRATVKLRHATRYEALLGPVRLLPTPPELEKAVEREVEDMAAQGRPVVGEARERLLESFKLRYYFGGQPFAYRETDQGKEVLAVGFKNMSRLLGELTPEEDEAVVSGFAEPW